MPMHGEARVEDGDGAGLGQDFGGPLGGSALDQGDAILVRGEAVEGGAVQAAEGLEPVEGGVFLEHMGQ